MTLYFLEIFLIPLDEFVVAPEGYNFTAKILYFYRIQLSYLYLNFL